MKPPRLPRQGPARRPAGRRRGKDQRPPIRQDGPDLHLFRKLVDRSKDFVSIIDLQSGFYLYVNRSTCRVSGYPLAEWRKLRVADIDPSVHETWDAGRERRRRRRDPCFRREGWLRKKNGETIPVEIVSSIGRLDGRSYLFASARDISERRKAEELLRESEEKYRTLVESTGDGIFVIDENLRFASMNPAGAGFSGRKPRRPEYFAGKTVSQAFSGPLADRFAGKLQTVLRTGRAAMDVPVEIRRRGQTVYQSVSLSPIKNGRGKTRAIVGIIRDVTNLMTAEAALRKEREHLRGTIDALPDLMFEVDRRGRIFDYHAPDPARLYTPPEKFLNKTVREVLPPAAADILMKSIAAALRDGHTPAAVYSLEMPGGRRWYEITAAALENPASTKGRCITLVRDITARKQVEDELRMKEIQLSTAMEVAKLAYWEYDPATDRFGLNDQFYSLFRTSAERVGGYAIPAARFAQLFLLPEDRPRMAGEIARAVKSPDPNSDLRLERRFRFADGKAAHMAIRFFPEIKSRGRPKVIHGILQDITELRRADDKLWQSETEHSALIEHMNDFVFVFARDGALLSLNHASARLQGKKKSQLVGRNIRELFPGDLGQRIALRIKTVFRSGRQFFSSESPITVRGKELWVKAILTPIKDQQGSVRAVLSVCQDITKQKMARQELLRQQERLRQLTQHLESAREDEQRRIARELHDELGQALTAMKLDLFWLLRQPILEREKAVAEKIQSIAALAERTMSALRNLTAKLRPAMLDDFGLIPAIEWLAGDFAWRTGIPVALSVKPEEFSSAPELATTVFRILQESLTNAARHSRATRIGVELIRRDGEIRLTVRDNGVGISRAELDDSGSFGLIGMRERVHAHGGRIEIAGRRGKGTTIAVALPLGRETAGEQRPARRRNGDLQSGEIR